MAEKKFHDEIGRGLEWAIRRVVDSKDGIELVKALLELAELGKLAKFAKGAGLWITIGMYVLQFAVKDPDRALSVAELTASTMLIGVPIDHTIALNIVNTLVEKRLIDKQHRPLPGVSNAIAGTEC